MFDYEKQHLDFVRSSAGECTVLLRSDGSFPISSAGRIALYGNGVRHTIKGGTGSGEVNTRFSPSIEEGLKSAGFDIESASWLDAYDEVREASKKKFLKSLKAEAKAKHENPILYSMGRFMPEPEYDIALNADCDTAVYVLSRDSGEGLDRSPVKGDVLLTDSEVRDILFLDETVPHFMLVLNTGGVVDLSPVKDVRNILVLSQLGVVNGDVLADVLLGRQNPSGRLTTSWASWEDYPFKDDFGGEDETCYREGIYVGYRYFDLASKKPIFPFGYGLSYSTFEVEPGRASVEGNIVRIGARVKNTGKAAGKEVVQVYLSAPSGELDKPYQELAAYSKTKELAPGESQDLSLSFALDEHATYSERTATYILDAGDYLVRIGKSSVDTKIAAAVTLDKSVNVLQVKNVIGSPGFKDYKPENSRKDRVPKDAQRLKMKAADIPSQKISYEKEAELDPNVKYLSDEELALLSVGSHDPKARGIMSVVGNASTHLAGAAGETTSMLEDKGIGFLTMSDGPAGLRLATEYYEDDEGAHAIGQSMIPASMIENLPGGVKFAAKLIGQGRSKAPRGARIKNQYASMIPISTAIAQSWNDELAESYADTVGDEMERFGVNLWLAPALNIHRSILCGRNFEYLSEDPLISGKMAAALTRGIQKHPGCSATVKHFAANNQEYCRYTNSSEVSERAMREIYLKGFGICIREASPHALMTSYNLLNGKHTSEHRGLIEGILRSEFGFGGLVMTDWLIAGTAKKKAKYRAADAGEIAMAGGGLVMPGSRSDYDKVLAKIKRSSVNRRRVELGATRLLALIRALKQ